ncbi:hypothetical protein X975_06561, partial [Stegodyphus mimosarum]
MRYYLQTSQNRSHILWSIKTMQVFIFRVDMKFFYFFWYLFAVAASAITFHVVGQNYSVTVGATEKSVPYIRFGAVTESNNLAAEECRDLLLHICGDKMVPILRFL